jgi:hypothetical protein
MGRNNTDRPGTDAVHETTFRTTTTERCDACDAETEHAVSVRIVVESDDYGGKQPHRTAECLACGHADEVRLGHSKRRGDPRRFETTESGETTD